MYSTVWIAIRSMAMNTSRILFSANEMSWENNPIYGTKQSYISPNELIQGFILFPWYNTPMSYLKSNTGLSMSSQKPLIHYSITLIRHRGLYKLYIIQEWPFLCHHAYCPFPWGSRFWSYPVICIIHNSGYIFISMHITQKAL